MTNPQIYLAGPITGCTYGGCSDWRQWVQDNLPEGLVGLSPMRHKQYLSTSDDVADAYPDSVLSSQRGILARDHWDCKRADAMLINLLAGQRVSIGTVMEIAWGHAYGVPMVLVMDDTNNLHDHAMIREACPFRVDSLEEGIAVLSALFIPADH